MKSRVCRVVNFSNGGSFVPIECVAGRQAMSGEQRHFNLLSNGAFVLFHTRGEMSTNLGQSGYGTWYTTFRFFVLTKGPSHVLACPEVVWWVCELWRNQFRDVFDVSKGSPYWTDSLAVGGVSLGGV